MTVSANDFWQQISRIGLVDAATCRAWVDKFQAIIAKKNASLDDAAAKPLSVDAVTVAQFLIANRVLTKFQSQRLLAGRGSELKINEYIVQDRCDQAPLSRWYLGRHQASQIDCFLYPCTDALTSSRWVDPEWLNIHQQLHADGLQPISTITLSETDPWRGAVVSEMPPGRSLDQWAADQGPLDHATVASIGLFLSGSLTTLHAGKLVHGELRPTRVWCGEDRSIWLLRDGGRPPAHPVDPPQEHRWFDDDSQADLYAAPELAVADSVPTAASDLFSLGALLFELATTRKLVQPDSAFQIPDEIKLARDSGANGDPLLRTLAYAIDPDPAARFADAESFARALAAVITAYESIPAAPRVEQLSSTVPPVSDSSPVSHGTSGQTVGVRAPTQVTAAEKAQSPTPATAVATKSKASSEQPISKPTPAQKPAPAKEQTAAPVVTPPPTAESATTTAPSPASPPRRVRRRTRRSQRGPIIIGGVSAVVLLGVFWFILQPSPEPDQPRSRPSLPLPRPTVATTTSPPDTTTPSPASTVGNGYELIQDDRLLWAPPWPPTSEPPPLQMIPPGSQLIATLRLNRIVGDSANTQWLDWLGQELKSAITALETRSGVTADEIERLTIAMSAGGNGNPKSTYTITTRQPFKLDAVINTWSVSASRTPEGKTIYTGDEPQADAYFFTDSPDAVRTFVLGPLDLVKLVVENEGAAIPLPRSMQQLWDATSSDADIVAITIPNFLFADGREMLRSYAPKAVDPLRSLLIPDVSGAVISMSLVDHWYFETRLTPSGSITAPALLQTIEPRIKSLPGWAESFAIDANVDASWRGMAIRLPQYMRAITDQTRTGVSATIPTVNFYLPSEAAPQVTLATILALSSPDTGPAETVATAPEMTLLTMDQMLDAKLSVSFDQESLQFAVTVIRDEFVRTLPAGTKPPTITIVGGDLEKAGITQNQQIRNFQMRSRPLRDALTELARQANPDKSVTALTDPKQSLVWAVDPTASADSPTILITTRTAAEAKKLPLPKEFITP